MECSEKDKRKRDIEVTKGILQVINSSNETEEVMQKYDELAYGLTLIMKNLKDSEMTRILYRKEKK